MSSEVISRLISELKPHPRNYNNHSDRQVDDLALSLKRFGQRKPIVTWRDMIVAGHGLTMAAQMAGWTSIRTMPIPDDWDEATVLAYLAADNELARQADPDLAQLAAITKELEGIDEELARLAAGGDDALKALMATIEDEKPNGDAEPQINKAEELRVKWGVELGQMWRLPSRDGKGEHRLICGDCTDRAVVERVMGDEKADLVFTSPPYNRGTSTGGGFNDGGLSQQLTRSYDTYSDDLPVEDYRKWQSDLLLMWWEVLTDEGAIYYNHRPRVQDGIYETPLDWNPNLPIRQIVIWHSGSGINFSPTHYRPSCEWIVIFAKKKFRLSSKGDSGIGDVWQFGSERLSEHPAPFPIDLPFTALKTTNSNVILEPFSGSGTTLIASENLSRRCRAIEISPSYTAIALQRYHDFFAITPELIHDR